MKTWIKKVYGFGIASFLSDFSHEMTVSLVPILVAQLVGLTQAPFFLGIISGFLSDRLPRKKPLIAIGYGISAVFSTLVGFTNSIWGILVYRILSFTGSGLCEPPRDTLIAATVGSKNYGRAFGLKNAMDTLGSLIGPLVAFICAGIISIDGIFILSFIPGILVVFAILFLTNDVQVSKKNYHNSRHYWEDFLLLPRKFIIFLSILFIFELSSFNKLLLLTRTQQILMHQNNIAQSLVLLYAIFNGIRAFSEFIIGLVSDYINRILLLAFLGCTPFALVAFLLILPQASFTYCAFIFGLAGIGTAALTTLTKACTADMLPSDIRGLGYGTLQASEGVANLFSNIFIGFLWTRYSAFIGFSYIIIISFISMGLLVGFWLSQIHKR